MYGGGDTCSEPRRQTQMLSASQTTLRADKAYIDLLEAESTWPMKYLFGQTNPVRPRDRPIQGSHTPGVGGCQADVYSSLLPTNFRMQVRASQNRLQTELFGTAPFLGLGQGVLKNTDTSSMLMQGTRVSERGARVLMERNYGRLGFVTVPAELRDLPHELRYGALTRVSASYLQPHDDVGDDGVFVGGGGLRENFISAQQQGGCPARSSRPW